MVSIISFKYEGNFPNLLNKDHWLPMGRHAKDLLEYSQDLINENTQRGIKIALILSDNAIEILLREYLRYYQKMSPNKVEDFRFHELITNSMNLKSVSSNEIYIQFHHDLRNHLYHSAALVPAQEDVLSGLRIAIQVFNELHPEHSLEFNLNSFPTQKTVRKLKEVSTATYVDELYVISAISSSLSKRGYVTSPNYPIGNVMIVDAIAIKQNEVIAIEVKSSKTPLKKEILDRLLDVQRYLQKDLNKETVNIWLVFLGVVPNNIRKEAGSLGITLIDDDNIRSYLDK